MKYSDIVVKMSKQLIKAAEIAKCVSNLACLEKKKKKMIRQD